MFSAMTLVLATPLIYLIGLVYLTAAVNMSFLEADNIVPEKLSPPNLSSSIKKVLNYSNTDDLSQENHANVKVEDSHKMAEDKRKRETRSSFCKTNNCTFSSDTANSANSLSSVHREDTQTNHTRVQRSHQSLELHSKDVGEIENRKGKNSNYSSNPAVTQLSLGKIDAFEETDSSTSQSSNFFTKDINQMYRIFGPFRFPRQSERDPSSFRKLRKSMLRMHQDEERKAGVRRRIGGMMKPIKGIRKGDIEIDEGDYGSIELSTPKTKQRHEPEATIRPKTKKHFPQFDHPKVNNMTPTGERELHLVNSYGREVDNETGKLERLKCRSVTRLVTDKANHKSVDSRGISFSEQTDDKKTLICKSETSELERAHSGNGGVIVRKGASGATIITQESNPFKLLDRTYQPRKETLEIGSSSQTMLDWNSKKNSTASYTATHDKKADSISKTRSRVVNQGDKPTAMESTADIEGNTAFDTRNKKPVVMTSYQEDSGMIVQSPNRQRSTMSPVTGDEDVKTFAEYRKKSKFEIHLGPPDI